MKEKVEIALPYIFQIGRSLGDKRVHYRNQEERTKVRRDREERKRRRDEGEPYLTGEGALKLAGEDADFTAPIYGLEQLEGVLKSNE